MDDQNQQEPTAGGSDSYQEAQCEGPSSPDAERSEADGPRSPSDDNDNEEDERINGDSPEDNDENDTRRSQEVQDDDDEEIRRLEAEAEEEEEGETITNKNEDDSEPDGPESPVDQKDSDDEEIRQLEAEAKDNESPEEDTQGSKNDEEQDEEHQEPESEDKDEEKDEDGDEEEEETKPKVDGQLIADIFGDSDSEAEDFEGFKRADKDEDEGERSGVRIERINDEDEDRVAAKDDDSSDDEGPDRSGGQSDIVYDFDLMMQRKREENYRRRKRKNIDIINDSDDVIAEMISQMKQAADEDFENNKSRVPALNKLRLLPRIEDPLRKIDLREALLDSGILSVITDWLTPLPDRSLPNVRVREVMLQVLLDFNISDTDRLKASGIGKAVMYLFKHPKETKDNKIKARRLIQSWSRPIFNNEADLHSMSREEREQRDQELMSRAKRMRGSSSVESTPVKKTPDKPLQPGDKGFIPRARVPMPSVKDYVNRPKSSSELEFGERRGSSKKISSRFEQMQRSFNEKKKASKATRAVKISIEGRRM